MDYTKDGRRIVFIVTEGTYDEYSIVRVFLRGDEAEKFVEDYNKYSHYLKARVEEWAEGAEGEGRFTIKVAITPQ